MTQSKPTWSGQLPFGPKPPPAARRWPSRSGGVAFTLIELTLVVLVLSMVAALVAPALSRVNLQMAIEADTSSLLALLRRCRSEAIKFGVPVEATFWPQRHEATVAVGEEQTDVEADWVTDLSWHRQLQLSPAHAQTEGPIRVRFAADGTTEADGLILKSRAGRGRRIRFRTVDGWPDAQPLGAPATPVEPAALERYWRQAISQQ